MCRAGGRKSQERGRQGGSGVARLPDRTLVRGESAALKPQLVLNPGSTPFTAGLWENSSTSLRVSSLICVMRCSSQGLGERYNTRWDGPASVPTLAPPLLWEDAGWGGGVDPGGVLSAELLLRAKVPTSGEPRTLPEGVCTQPCVETIYRTTPSGRACGPCQTRLQRREIHQQELGQAHAPGGSRPPNRSQGAMSKCPATQKSAVRGWTKPG